MDLFKVAEIELVYKQNGNTSQRPKVTKGEEAYNILLAHWDESKIDLLEQSKILLLNRANRVLGICNMSSGGIAGTVVDPRLIFVTALKANASAIILAHNHPSGNLTPSMEDKKMTNRLMDVGKIVEVEVLDNIIVTSRGYYSFAEQMAYEKVQRGHNFYMEALPPF